jgi:hypothetical protein
VFTRLYARIFQDEVIRLFCVLIYKLKFLEGVRWNIAPDAVTLKTRNQQLFLMMKVFAVDAVIMSLGEKLTGKNGKEC